MLGYVQKVVTATIDKPALLIAGSHQDFILYRVKSSIAPSNYDQIKYVYLVPLEKLRKFQDDGYNVYYLKDVLEYTKRIYDYDLSDWNAIYLDVNASDDTEYFLSSSSP